MLAHRQRKKGGWKRNCIRMHLKCTNTCLKSTSENAPFPPRHHLLLPCDDWICIEVKRIENVYCGFMQDLPLFQNASTVRVDKTTNNVSSKENSTKKTLNYWRWLCYRVVHIRIPSYQILRQQFQTHLNYEIYLFWQRARAYFYLFH